MVLRTSEQVVVLEGVNHIPILGDLFSYKHKSATLKAAERVFELFDFCSQKFPATHHPCGRAEKSWGKAFLVKHFVKKLVCDVIQRCRCFPCFLVEFYFCWAPVPQHPFQNKFGSSQVGLLVNKKLVCQMFKSHFLEFFSRPIFTNNSQEWYIFTQILQWKWLMFNRSTDIQHVVFTSGLLTNL